ncbi:MAG: CDP-diacylglycerol--glycerol-3-phosphate 3-phosphatidyltransferase [Peptococcaceae bacterium BRH_c4a]|nr:MAG: CDP-diacylglycerol--glycerol-3-phosphate 3-phosphatidyltransferase [Peptococcaceae bacterium BRH_c4a]
MNLPNRLTMVRIFLIPVFVAAVTLKIPHGDYIAASIFILAASTDGLDGYIARKRKMITNLGKIMDPLADKLLVTAALLVLVELHRLPSWVALIIIGREFAVTGLRAMAAAEGSIISAGRLGKVKTITQIVAMVALFIKDLPIVLGYTALSVAVFYTVWSGWDYFYRSWRVIKKNGI